MNNEIECAICQTTRVDEDARFLRRDWLPCCSDHERVEFGGGRLLESEAA